MHLNHSNYNEILLTHASRPSVTAAWIVVTRTKAHDHGELGRYILSFCGCTSVYPLWHESHPPKVERWDQNSALLGKRSGYLGAEF